MRISSNTIFDNNAALLNQQQARLAQTQQQIASGNRMSMASDDPVAATRALEIKQSDAINTQYAANRTTASHTLSLAEGSMQSVVSLLQDVQTAVISAGNGSFGNGDRKVIATQLSGKLQELVGLANSTDGAGNYLFSGFQSKTPPFADMAGVITYNGDDGQRLTQASASRQVASSDSGADVFMRVKNGNGTFVTQPGTNAITLGANTGTGIISIGSVSSPPPTLPLSNYSVAFTVAAGVTTYTVTNTTNGNPTVPPLVGTPYVSGQAISFDGMQFDIKGTPADGDTFTVTPSANESLFKTIADLIVALNTPAATPANGGTTSLTNSLTRGLNNLDNALNNVATIQASMGLRLNEIDALQTAGDDLGLQFKQTLQKLQDTDYNKAISDLTMQQMSLQAAQKSFVKVSDLSLFSYL